MFSKEITGINIFNDTKKSFFKEEKVLYNINNSQEEQDLLEQAPTLQKAAFGEEFEVKNIDDDVKTVLKTLDDKWGSLRPTSMTTLTKHSIMKGTEGSAEGGFSSKVRDMTESFKGQFAAKSEATKKEYERLNYEENLLQKVLINLEENKDKAENQKKTLLKMRKSLNAQRSILNPFKYTEKASQGIDNWKFEKSEIKGTTEKIKRVRIEEKDVHQRKKTLDRNIENAFKKEMATKNNLISYMGAIEGVTEEEVAKLLPHIVQEGGKIKVNSESKLSETEKEELEKTATAMNTFLESNSSEDEVQWFKEALQSFRNEEHGVFTKASGGDLLAYEENKKSQEKLKDLSEIQEKYKNLKVGGKLTLGKTKIEGGSEEIPAGDFLIAKNSSNKIVLLREDFSTENSVKNFIVLDSSTMKYNYAKTKDLKGITDTKYMNQVRKMRDQLKENITNIITENKNTTNTTMDNHEWVKQRQTNVKKIREEYSQLLKITKIPSQRNPDFITKTKDFLKLNTNSQQAQA
jgi:hypothetical protein